MLLLLACTGASSPDPEPVSPRCGDGVVDADEACDDGAANSDTASDACRSTCLLPTCGDAVVDAGETCDDGALLGGDGCDGACTIETGTLEVEPNDDVATATVASELVHGSLDEGDVDCWSFTVERCGAVEITQSGTCGPAMTLSLYDPTGAWVAAGSPEEDGCAHLDPADQPGARWVTEGTWTVCAAPVLDGAVPSYTLTLATPDASALEAYEFEDQDDDLEPDTCDLDRDGDGLDNDADNCPDLSNGPATVLELSDSGYVTTWLGSGPYTGDASTQDCRPAEEARVGEDGESFAPAAEDGTWDALLLESGWFDLYTFYGTVDAPREAYAMVYLWSDTDRSATLAVGADDGVFAWWNADRVIDVSSCQGVTVDQFTAAVDIVSGWNTLLLKVRDQGGAWALTARLLDSDGQPITDLQPGLDPDGAWLPDQADTDGDGVGDVCQ